MLLATHHTPWGPVPGFGQSIDDIAALVPVLVQASNSVNTAVERMGALAQQVSDAVGKIGELPSQVVASTKTAVRDVSYEAGKGAARGFGWNILLPLVVGTAVVLGGVGLYTVAMRHQAAPRRRLARGRA